MFPIVHARQLSDAVFEMGVSAPRIARKVRAGQFLMLRTTERGERIPLTFSDWSAEEGWIRFIFMRVGKTTHELSHMTVGDELADVVGPLGRPTETEGLGKVAVVGGGVGAAVAYPVARAMCEAGARVTVVLGARNSELLILEEEFRALPIREFVVVTDDGSAGRKGLVTAPVKELCETGAVDHVFAVGPAVMMKFCSATASEHGVPVTVSLNPIMVDGTGMCGACRVTVAGDTRFGCVDGPDFDGSAVDFEELMSRQRVYADEEREADVEFGEELLVPPVDDTPRRKPSRAPRTPMPEREARERAADFDEVGLGYSEKDTLAEAMRCLQCKNPTCIEGCPVNIDIKRFIDHAARGEWADGIAVIKERNALPSVCGRVCPQESQCEAACVLARKGEPVAIGRIERFLGDRDLSCDPEGRCRPFVGAPTGKRAAVVGAGPAGLACAGELRRRGHEVTVFESLHAAGGVLVYGIPEFRLPKSIVEAEVEGLREMGVEIVTDVVVGATYTLDELMAVEDFDSVFLGVGAGLPVFMGIPGENLNGVYSANEFLTRANLMKAYEFPKYDTPIRRGRKVAVVGGGNVAMDSARTALRLGAEHVSLVYRRTEDEMPARREEVHHAREEGVLFEMLCSPAEILGKDGWVTGLTAQRMELGEPDESGRRAPVCVLGSDFTIDCDTVVMAIGTRANPLLTSGSDLELTERGYIVTDENGATSKPGVYAGGDIVTGSATVILAMGAGKRAASAMDEYLSAVRR